MSHPVNTTSPDVSKIVQEIREQIARRTGAGQRPGAIGAGSNSEAGSRELIATLQNTLNDLNAFGLDLERGEPHHSPTLRSRIGFWVKQRLYRLMWWQGQQVKTLSALITRLSADQLQLALTLLNSCKWQLDKYETRLNELEKAQLKLQSSEIERAVREKSSQSRDERESLLQQELADIKQQLTALRESLGHVKLDELSDRLSHMGDRISELGLYTHQTRTTLNIQDRRIALFLDEARRRLPEPFSAEQVKQLSDQERTHRYDALYVAFEDLFRGSREEIKAKQSIYLPLLKEHGIGSSFMPVLDLGCGRGEWLELLHEHDIKALGVDQNEVMIEYSRAADLNVIQEDALAYLRKVPDASKGAITSFHMVEHLPIELTLLLIDEALRVLKHGGLLILETPNAQNILVGAHNFYYDPTHLRPLPSGMLRFFVEARGFSEARILDLHPFPETAHFPDDGRVLTRRLNDYFYGSQDYAIVAKKP